MFTTNLLKKPKLDAKRLQAVAYFNNKFPNSPIVEKSGFWSLNRVKILASAFFVFSSALAVKLTLKDDGFAFLALLAFLASIYVIAPIFAAIFCKCSVETLKKIKFVRVSSRLYRQSELPSGVVFSAIWLSAPGGLMITAIMVLIIQILNTKVPESFFFMIPIFPFFMYHLLCFIGDHPITIFTAINHQTDEALARFQKVPHTQHNSSYHSSSATSMSSEDDGLPGASWVSTYSSCSFTSVCTGSDIDNRS